MKIISYNVNGIRAAIKKDLVEWLKNEDPDIFCIQETKAQPDQIDPLIFGELGYHAEWHSAEKKGYSGVLTLSKMQPNSTTVGIGIDKYDSEGRVIRTDFENFSLLNCYFPSGSASEERHAFKMDFVRDFEPHVRKLLKKQPNLIILGDYNIVRLDIDIHNPSRKDNPSGFRPEERKWLNDWFENGFEDAFRFVYPDQEDAYSWWSYRAGSRQKNKGWRIDYISVSDPIAAKIKDVKMDRMATHSDHGPVILEIDI
ncbi:MAG: exodeoxyribonuclease III [Saprospiraceae bacterium]|nr:exodeoxyribonuclease III [Saprospiraceae bacterium]